MEVTMNQLWALVVTGMAIGVLVLYMIQVTYQMWLLGKPSEEEPSFEIITITICAFTGEEHHSSDLFYTLADADKRYGGWINDLERQHDEHSLDHWKLILRRIHDDLVMQQDAS